MNIPGLPPWDAPYSAWGMDPKYRLGYVNSKYVLAQRYHPKRICEIGVYSGIAACCFLAASPQAEYVGIDNCEVENGVEIVTNTQKKLIELGYNASIIIDDSQRLTGLPSPYAYDFIHVDGNHATAAAAHDTELAWRFLTPNGVLLVDDCHNMQVVAGVAAALDPITDLLNWSYIDEGVGTMVIHKEPRIR